MYCIVLESRHLFPKLMDFNTIIVIWHWITAQNFLKFVCEIQKQKQRAPILWHSPHKGAQQRELGWGHHPGQAQGWQEPSQLPTAALQGLPLHEAGVRSRKWPWVLQSENTVSSTANCSSTGELKQPREKGWSLQQMLLRKLGIWLQKQETISFSSYIKLSSVLIKDLCPDTLKWLE